MRIGGIRRPAPHHEGRTLMDGKQLCRIIGIEKSGEVEALVLPADKVRFGPRQRRIDDILTRKELELPRWRFCEHRKSTARCFDAICYGAPVSLFEAK